MLYDITNKDSLDDLHDWVNVITSVPNHPKTRLLVEAKIDLESQREVNHDDAKALFDKYKFQGDIHRVSSKTGENVENVFETLGREIIKNSVKKCTSCDKFYPLELKYCQYCGQKTR